MNRLAVTALVLVLVLVSVSAYLRLDQSGIGCADWPACYGQIGADGTVEDVISGTTGMRSWATLLHRFVASVLGLLILAIALLAVAKKRYRGLAFSLLALTVSLAWLGIYSAGLHKPAIVMGNLAGGFGMLALVAWLVLGHARTPASLPKYLPRWVAGAFALLCLQVLIGGLTSTNFAASACQTLPDCHGSYLPGAALITALDLSREHKIGASGLALGGPERADIHKLHRLAALVTTLAILFVSIAALRAGIGLNAWLTIGLVLLECGVGVAAILTSIPIEIAVAHNWLAALLLLSLLRLFALCRNRQAFP